MPGNSLKRIYSSIIRSQPSRFILSFLTAVSFGPNLMAGESEPEKLDEGSTFGYRVQEGDRWRETIQRSLELETSRTIGKSGYRPEANKRKIEAHSQYRMNTESRIQSVSVERFEVRMVIRRFQFRLEVPFLNIDYDSSKDRSGIYERIFGKLVDHELILVLNDRGHLQDTRGMDSMLEAARNNLPEEGGGMGFSFIIRILKKFLQKELFSVILTWGWFPLPERIVFRRNLSFTGNQYLKRRNKREGNLFNVSGSYFPC